MRMDPQLKCCHIGSKNEVDKDVIERDLQDRGVTVIRLEENPNNHGYFKSFKLTVTKDDLQKVDDPMFWSNNVKVRPFFLARKPRATMQQ
jgi:hypothetical protein